MSRGPRLGLIAVAVTAAAVAFVLARPDGDEESAPSPVTDTTTRRPAAAPQDPTATTDARPEVRIALRGHRPAGGARRIEARRGQLVRLVVESDAPDEIHVHGYDLESEAGPDSPARFSFRADIEGIFEIESHEAEHEGVDAVIARLVVEPS